MKRFIVKETISPEGVYIREVTQVIPDQSPSQANGAERKQREREAFVRLLKGTR